MSKQVQVGVAALIYTSAGLLLGKRCGSHGANTWAPPGGHIDFAEQPKQAVKRELLEETGLSSVLVLPGPWTNDYFPDEDKHYITLFFYVKAQGCVTRNEPDKCLQWKCFSWEDLPCELFLPLQHFIDAHPAPDFAISHEITLE